MRRLHILKKIAPTNKRTNERNKTKTKQTKKKKIAQKCIFFCQTSKFKIAKSMRFLHINKCLEFRYYAVKGTHRL